MDKQKEQSIKEKLQAIKLEDETTEVRTRKLKSLINQMNLRLFENPNEKPSILTLQKLGYETILYVLDNDTTTNSIERQQQKEKTQNLIEVIENELQKH